MHQLCVSFFCISTYNNEHFFFIASSLLLYRYTHHIRSYFSPMLWNLNPGLVCNNNRISAIKLEFYRNNFVTLFLIGQWKYRTVTLVSYNTSWGQECPHWSCIHRHTHGTVERNLKKKSYMIQRMKGKAFYLLCYSIALRTLSLLVHQVLTHCSRLHWQWPTISWLYFLSEWNHTIDTVYYIKIEKQKTLGEYRSHTTCVIYYIIHDRYGILHST